MGAGIIDEVRGFLTDLRRDWPELFPLRPKPKPVRALPKAERPVPRILPATPMPAPPVGTPEALFHERASYWAVRMGVDFGRVKVKGQRSLWGSCSREGNLNFNWRLTLAPSEVLNYVVIHELAHRLEMNHSRRFWAHVEKHVPDYRIHRRWLRKNTEALYRHSYRKDSTGSIFDACQAGATEKTKEVATASAVEASAWSGENASAIASEGER